MHLILKNNDEKSYKFNTMEKSMKQATLKFPRTKNEVAIFLDNAREMAGLEREGIVDQEWEPCATSLFSLQEEVEIELEYSGIKGSKARAIGNTLIKPFMPSRKEELFFSLIYRDMTHEVSSMLQKDNKLVLSVDEEGNTALSLAAKNDQILIMKLCLEHGADINHQNYADMTALHLAARDGRMYALKTLIAAGADVNKIHSGSGTALSDALRDERYGVFTQLIKSGATYQMLASDTRGDIYLPDSLVAQYQQSVDEIREFCKSEPRLLIS